MYLESFLTVRFCPNGKECLKQHQQWINFTKNLQLISLKNRFSLIFYLTYIVSGIINVKVCDLQVDSIAVTKKLHSLVFSYHSQVSTDYSIWLLPINYRITQKQAEYFLLTNRMYLKQININPINLICCGPTLLNKVLKTIQQNKTHKKLKQMQNELTISISTEIDIHFIYIQHTQWLNIPLRLPHTHQEQDIQ